MVSVVLVVPMAAGPAYGACRSRVATIGFYTWRGFDTITFAGTTYSNGQTTIISWGCGQSYQIREGTTLGTFRQWASDAGTFSSQTSTPATFYPSGDSGAIAMVLNDGIPASNSWGGYVADISILHPGPGYTYDASLEFTIPSLTYNPNQPPNDYQDVMTVWPGIGGISGALWQGGIRITVYSGGGYTIQEFTDYCSSPSSCQSENLMNSPGVVGDTISIIISYSSSGGATYSIQNLGPSTTWTRSGSCSGSCVPDLSTSEIVVEPEYEAGIVTACGVPISGGCCVLPNFGTIPVNNNAWAIPGADWSFGLLRMDAESQYPNGNTYANPGYLTSGSRFNSGSFSRTFGTSPT